MLTHLTKTKRRVLGFLLNRLFGRTLDMTELRCQCGTNRKVEFYEYYRRWADERGKHYSQDDRFVITVQCRDCGRKTTYELHGMAIVGAPTRLSSGQLGADVGKVLQDLAGEATDCLSVNAYRGALALCRAAVEQALVEKNVKGHDLKAKIEAARKATPPLLGEQEATQAHAARLDGNEGLYEAEPFSQSQAVLALVSCIEVVNHLATQASIPASATP